MYIGDLWLQLLLKNHCNNTIPSMRVAVSVFKTYVQIMLMIYLT